MGEDRLGVLSAARPWLLSDEALVAGFDALHALTVEAQAALVRFTVEIDARKAASRVGASSTSVWWRNRHRVGIRSAHRLVRLARRIEAAPAVVGEGVAVGAVNLDQADVVTWAVARIPAEVGVDVRERAAAELVRLCGELDADLLKTVGERILSVVAPEVADELDRKAMERAEAQAQRERYFTMTPDGVGVRLSGRLSAEGAAVVRAAIEPLCSPVAGDGRTAEQRRADALVDVCKLALTTTDLPENGGDRPQVVVGVDFDTITQQLGAGTLDNGDRITPETARRMACDAGLVPMVLNGHGVPLDVGRSRRLVTGPLRRALVARDRGCCFPGCDRGARWAEAHHVRHWSHGGPTSAENTLLICTYHHGELHKPDSWTVFIAPDGLPTFIPPTHVDPLQRRRRNKFHRRQ
jgi:hypothetical protein